MIRARPATSTVPPDPPSEGSGPDGPLRADDDHEPAGIGPARQRLCGHVELFCESQADRLATGWVVDLRLRIVEARRLADVRDTVRERLDLARDRSRVDDVAASVQHDHLD